MTFEWMKNTDARMDKVYALRREVFVGELELPSEMERDEQDDAAQHVVGIDDNGLIICTGRVLEQAPGVYQVGRIAVFRGARGRGYGRRILNMLTVRARTVGGKAAAGRVGKETLGFCFSGGFVQEGDEFLYGGKPHVNVRCAL